MGGIFVNLGKIQLHGAGCVVGLGIGDEARTDQHHYQHKHCRAGEDRQPPFRRMLCFRVAPGEQRIE